MANVNDPTPSSLPAPPLSDEEIIARHGFVEARRDGRFGPGVDSQAGFRKRQPLLRDHPLTYQRLEGRSSGRIRR